jgi:hypothetical protein
VPSEDAKMTNFSSLVMPLPRTEVCVKVAMGVASRIFVN